MLYCQKYGERKDIQWCQPYYNSQLLNLQLYYPLSLHLIWVISQISGICSFCYIGKGVSWVFLNLN